MRNATAYGASPRMRFDIVLNQFAGFAWTTGQIVMNSDGSPWRPLVHALDIAEAFACVLDAPVEAVHNQIFNVGCNDENYRVREIAEIVAAAFPRLRDAPTVRPNNDGRSYRVSFDKIATGLPGFQCRWNAAKGAARAARHLRADPAHAGAVRRSARSRGWRSSSTCSRRTSSTSSSTGATRSPRSGRAEGADAWARGAAGEP